VDGVKSHITVTLVIVGAVDMINMVRNWCHAVVSNRRRYRMKRICIINETIAKNPNQPLDIDMDDAEHRLGRRLD